MIRFLKKLGRQLPVLKDIHRYILALEAEREELRKTVADQRGDLAEAHGTILALEAEREELRKTVADQRDDLAEAHGTILALEAEREELRKTVATQRDDLAEARETTRKLWVPPGDPRSPIPDLEDVRRRESELFGKPPEDLPGIDTLAEEQLTIVREMKRWGAEPPFPQDLEGRRSSANDPDFGWADTALLHAFLRKLRPRRIVCAGAGPFVPALLDLNEHVFGRTISITVVDPDAERLRPLLKKEDEEKVRLLPARVHEVPFDTFTSLASGDVLCLDTGHVSKTGSDLNHLLFRVFPRLKGGIHVHPTGVFWPFEYPNAWVAEGRAWNEAYLWRAFLQHNTTWEIVVFASFLEMSHRLAILKELPQWQRSRGGGLWLRRKP